jgi:TonB family protein
LFVSHEAHLVVRTETGLFEKDEAKFGGKAGGFEFTLPTHERVISAWVDGVRAPDGSMVKCDPTGAFFVNNYNTIQLTKQYKRHEDYSRAIIDLATQTDLGFGIKVRKVGRRPDGLALPMPTPCTEDDRLATIAAALIVTSSENVSPGITPSVTVDVSPRGSVMDVDIKQSAGSRSLDDAMIAAARKTAFTPARWKCNAIPDRMIVSAVFVKAISDKL